MYEKIKYDKTAKETTENLLKLNRNIKKIDNNDTYMNLYTESISTLESVSIPIYDFSKTLLNYKSGESLIKYIDFKNNQFLQEFYIYNNQKFIGFYELPDTFLKKLEAGEDVIENGSYKYQNLIFSYEENKNNYLGLFDVIYLNKEKFIFKIQDEYCIILNEIVYVIKINLTEVKYIEFNEYFISQLNYLQNTIKGDGNKEYDEYINKTPIKKEKIIIHIK
ncbi:hypothetical protein [Epilithonimonas hominis]|nr:hypothetical protein [Epilithonimonas hominis]